MLSTTPRSVSQSTLNIPTITQTRMSQSPLTKEKILEVYADIFNGLGTFPDLNEALKYEPYYSCSVDELIAKFHRCKVFSIIDMKKGYWMVPLHPESRPLKCMSIDIGRYQWT